MNATDQLAVSKPKNPVDVIGTLIYEPDELHRLDSMEHIWHHRIRIISEFKKKLVMTTAR